MNTDPEEYDLPPEARLHKARPFVIILLLLLICASGLFFIYARSGGGKPEKGTGSSNSGTGTGSGQAGTGTGSGLMKQGTGAGKKGTGTGKRENASGHGTGAGKKGFGTGATPHTTQTEEQVKGRPGENTGKTLKQNSSEAVPMRKLSPKEITAYRETCQQIRGLASKTGTPVFPEAGTKGTSIQDQGSSYLVDGFFEIHVPQKDTRRFNFTAKLNKLTRLIEDYDIAEQKKEVKK